jgi:hypothetical protein
LKLVDAEMSWLDISYVMEKDEGECKDRFDKIKPKEWDFCGPKEKGLCGSGAAKKKKKGTMSSAEFVDNEVQNGWDTGINGKPISDPCDSYCGNCGSLEPECACNAGWFAESSAGGWGDCSQLSDQKAPEFMPQPDASRCISYQYWATIESEGSEIKIPIDSDSVSGLEKTIATKDLPKVWKWVHDKGLGDKVGLQDAFDLARSIHKNDVGDGDFRTIGHRAEPRLSYCSSEVPMKQGFNPWTPW